MSYLFTIRKDRLGTEFLVLFVVFILSAIIPYVFFDTLNIEIKVEDTPIHFPPIGLIVSIFALISYVVYLVKVILKRCSDNLDNILLLLLNAFVLLEFSAITKIIYLMPHYPMPQSENILKNGGESFFIEQVEYHYKRLELLGSTFSFAELILIISLISISIFNGMSIARYQMRVNSQE